MILDKIKIPPLFYFLILFLFNSCSNSNVSIDGYTMGTTYSIKIYSKKYINSSNLKEVIEDKLNYINSIFSTYDDSKKDGELLFNIGLAGRLLAEENLSEEELSNIKGKIIKLSQNRQVNGKMTYRACLNFVSATK